MMSCCTDSHKIVYWILAHLCLDVFVLMYIVWIILILYLFVEWSILCNSLKYPTKSGFVKQYSYYLFILLLLHCTMSNCYILFDWDVTLTRLVLWNKMILPVVFVIFCRFMRTVFVMWYFSWMNCHFMLLCERSKYRQIVKYFFLSLVRSFQL